MSVIIHRTPTTASNINQLKIDITDDEHSISSRYTTATIISAKNREHNIPMKTAALKIPYKSLINRIQIDLALCRRFVIVEVGGGGEVIIISVEIISGVVSFDRDEDIHPGDGGSIINEVGFFFFA